MKIVNFSIELLRGEIIKIILEGLWLWCEDPFRIKSEMKRHFSRIFSKGRCMRPKLRSTKITKLNEDESKYLERLFEEGEVWKAVCGCGGDKAPGPDGFNFKFI